MKHELIRQILLAPVVAAALWAGTANATVVTLDFDSVATGSDIINNPLVTAAGTITASATGNSSIFLAAFPGGTGDGLRHSQSVDSDYALLSFDFDATSVSFLYAGFTSGDFLGEILDAGMNVIGSFFDDDTNNDLPGGPVTLSAAGIRYFRFLDSPSSGTQSGVDNVVITVPEPAGISLLGLGLLGLAAARRRARGSIS